MDCIIPGQNVKVLARALQALAKVGDELFLEARSEKLSLLTFNMTKTVCAQFHFLDSYFSRYILSDPDLVTCKIHMKILLPLFKGINLEKKLEFVKIEYQSISDLIIFKLKYKLDDIVMIHKLRLMDPEVLSISNIVNSTDNNLCATSDFYVQLLSVFSSTDSDITFEITKEKVVVRNYCTGAPQKSKSVRSQVKLNAAEFDVFKITNESTINFSLKPLRTFIHFAECFNLKIGFDFEKGGRPLNITTKHPTFEVNFMVATLDPYNDAVSTIASASLPSKLTQINNNRSVRHDLTVEDIEALQNENWNEFDIQTGHLGECQSSTKSTTSKKSKKENGLISLKPIKTKSTESDTEDETNQNKNTKKKKLDNHPKLFDLDVMHKNEDFESPESPRTKKTRLLFQRSLEPTFHQSMIEADLLAPNSDSE